MIEQAIVALVNKHGELSDIHLQAGGGFWIRKAGLLELVPGIPVTNESILEFLEKASKGRYAPKDFDPDCGKVDLDAALNLGGIRLRGNLFSVHNAHLAMALRPLKRELPVLETLGVPDYVFSLADRAKGLFLVTGPTGAGKSTTLVALLNQINNTRRGHILTIEDPVEFIVPSNRCLVAQRELGLEAGSSYEALKYALRQDPDVIMIGEMRDKKTVELALTAAETGHLVLSTLHTANARQSVDRIASFFAGEEKDWVNQVLASVLIGVLSQALIEGEEGDRVLICELMVNTSSVSQAIREGRTHQIDGCMETGSSEGQQLFNDELVHAVNNGRISIENALYYAYDQPGLSRALKRGRTHAK